MPNMYSFSFLIEMTPKTEGGKAMRSKKLKLTHCNLQCGHRSWCGPNEVAIYDDCSISMQFYRHFTDSVLQPCDCHAGAVQLF